ncbi:hypothetical protein [Phormidium nigroviride]
MMNWPGAIALSVFPKWGRGGGCFGDEEVCDRLELELAGGGS